MNTRMKVKKGIYKKSKRFYCWGCREFTKQIPKYSEGWKGKKYIAEFKSKEDFLNYCIKENEDIEDMVNNNDFDIKDLIIENVSEDYIRYYPKMPEGFELESGWTFCGKGRGALAVYVYTFN